MSGFETFRSHRYVPTNQFNNLSAKETTKLQKKLLTLIIRAKPLYCHADPDFNNVAKNRLEWVIIAEKCRSTVPECINLWYSLLRTYFSLANDSNWLHKELFERMEPFLSRHELQKPTEEQKLIVLNELEASQYSEDAVTYMNGIWLQITAQCNAIVPGAIMSSLNWKKYWLSLRQQLATKLSTGALKSSLNEVQLRILTICGVDLSASISDIVKVLDKNGEQNPGKTVNVSFKCKRCSNIKDDVTLNGFCASCRKESNLCNICTKETFHTQYDITNWSKQALNLLPKALNLYSRAKGSGNQTTIFVCTNCSEELMRRAKWVWEMCRICLKKDTRPQNMSYLFSNKFKDLRTNIADCLKVEFKANDALPGLICQNCVTELEHLCQYIKFFHQNQNELLRIHSKHFIGDIGEGQSLEASKPKCQPLKLCIKDVFSMHQNEQNPNISQVPSLRFEKKVEEIRAEKKTYPSRPKKNLQSPLQTTKPAVFTISDRVGSLPSPVDPVSIVPLPIKREPDELIDFVSDFPAKMIKTEPINDVPQILETHPAVPIAISPAAAAVPIKVVKINGVTTAVKLHPYIPGVYIPVNSPGIKNGIPMDLEEPPVQNIHMNLEPEANAPATNQEESQESFFPSNLSESVFKLKREAVEEVLCEPTITLPVEDPSPAATSRFQLRNFQIKLNREKVSERNPS